jgi:putative adhesin
VTRRLPMTAGRVLALCVGVPAMLGVIVTAALSEVAYAGQGSYHVRLDLPARGRSVRVSIDSGALDLISAAGGRLRVTGTAHYSLIRSTVSRRITPALVGVSTRCRSVPGVCSFSFHVGLPAGVPAYLADSAGDITGTGLTNKQLTASDSAGDITLTFAAIPDRVRVSDSLGDVTLVLPASPTGYRVNAQTSLGHTSIRVPTSPSSPHVISVTDSSGDIVIRGGS